MRAYVFIALVLFQGCEDDPKPERKIVAAVCDETAIDACYAKLGNPGERDGHLTAWVDDSGSVVRTNFRGNAMEAVVACLLERTKKQSDPTFKGRAGVVECSWSGWFDSGRLRGWRKKRYLID